MSPIEYRGYRISVSAREQNWGFAFGEWSGAYRIWQNDSSEPIDGVIQGSEPSAYAAEKKALHLIKTAIDDAIRHSGEHLRSTLTQPDSHPG